ncbi:MAG: extracellular solute-binding protein [Candidatus Riflebacteria bacterium]|nr:extracellular solute-binding protein [Candidatus Riflebacteria bacterium]
MLPNSLYTSGSRGFCLDFSSKSANSCSNILFPRSNIFFLSDILKHSCFSNKILIFVFAVFFIFLSNASECEPLNINLWDFPRWLEPGEKTDRFRWIKRQIQQFEKENPEIKVTLTELSWGKGDEKLKISAIAGRNPDIAPGTVPLLFIREGLIEPIDEWLNESDQSDYLKGALKAFTVDGKIYGWPWYMGGQMLFVNTDIFASAGISLPENRRWTEPEFSTVLEKLRKHMNGTGEYPLGLFFQKNETANFPFAFIAGGDWLNEKREFLGDSVETLNGLKWLRELVEKKYIPPDSGGRTSQDAWDGFAREKRTAISAFGLWAISALRTKYPMNYQIMHFPAPEEKTNPPFLGVSGFYVFKNADKTRVNAAMKLARFLTLSERQRDLVHYTQFPTRASASDIYANDPQMKSAWEVLKDGRTVLNDPRWPQFDEEIESSIQTILLGEKKPEDAMKAARERIVSQMSRQTASMNENLEKKAWFGKFFMGLFPIMFIFAIFTGNVHLIFILPALSVIGIFLWYPLGEALSMAFTDCRFGSVGEYTLSNFIRAIEDPKFAVACKNTVIYTIVVVPANVFTALIMASLISTLTGRMKSFYRAMYYLPGVASVVVLTMVWRWIFNYDFGLGNTFLRFFGFNSIGWITDPNVAFFSVMLTGILRSPGGAMLIYLAAIANLPKSLFESAHLEGATDFQCWRLITVPLLRSTTLFLCITGCIDALQVFAQVFMLTNGGPGYSTEVVVHRVYTAAFRDFEFGLSSAMALLLFFSILIITIVQKKVAPGGDHEIS